MFHDVGHLLTPTTPTPAPRDLRTTATRVSNRPSHTAGTNDHTAHWAESAGMPLGIQLIALALKKNACCVAW